VTLLDWIFGKSNRQKLARLQFLLQIGYSNLKAERYEEARRSLLEALKSRELLQGSPLLDWLLQTLDCAYLFDERFEEEITFFSEYLARYPDDLAGYNARAAAFWYMENWPQAVNDYSYVLQSQPENILALSGRGQILAEMGNFQAALDDLGKALQAIRSVSESDAKNMPLLEYEAFARRGRSDALAGLGDLTEALAELEISLRLCPENAWAYYSRAQVYEKIGEQEKATADYEIALLKKGPKLTPSRRERAHAWLQNR
jgi:tetratricopeptide (TPR) repeat protein